MYILLALWSSFSVFLLLLSGCAWLEARFRCWAPGDGYQASVFSPTSYLLFYSIRR